MHVKCSYCDFTLRTVTSVILWLDVIIFSIILSVEIASAQDKSCLEENKDCSSYYRIAEFLLIYVFVALVALYGVRQNKPALLLPYIIYKCLFTITIAMMILFRNEEPVARMFDIDRFNVIALCIILGFQFYSIFIAVWSYNKVKKARAACSQKSFKSVISIWIGDTSNSASTSDSTCIIESER